MLNCEPGGCFMSASNGNMLRQIHERIEWSCLNRVPKGLGRGNRSITMSTKKVKASE